MSYVEKKFQFSAKCSMSFNNILNQKLTRLALKKPRKPGLSAYLSLRE
jgi:hypothetical protein